MTATQYNFAPGTEAGRRVRTTARRAAQVVYRQNGLAAFQIVSTPEKAVQVGLLALQDGVKPMDIVAGFSKWLATHPKKERKTS